MNFKIIVESFLNTIDIGVIYESLKHFKNRTWETSTKDILRYLIFGKGYKSLTPPEYNQFIKDNRTVEIIDLREPARFKKSHIENSRSIPLDDFLKDVLNGTYKKNTDLKTLLVCDTGSLSKVAASVLVEAGFKENYNLKGGIRRFKRWVKLAKNIQMISCCIHSSL
ncbi:MAG: rhodanese-like domain-containing protein [Desulfobacterales bacterium]|nr:rhodanese-like domain-containing protein [Desulfobacterales bacterium]MCP4161963.1 rhodanese-like domain-containing protein [Deltaproteobacteria bacterium]